MSGNGTIRKALTAMLGLTILLWAEAGLALVAGDQVMQCSMSAHEMQAMGDMPCCPGEEMQIPAMAPERPPCCSVSNDAERPLAFLVSSERTTPHHLDISAQDVVRGVSQPTQYHGELWNADAPRFVRPILELKTDLRI